MTAVDLDPSDHDHAHCLHCFRPASCTQPHPCPVITCPNECSALFHACKVTDHLLYICPYQLVPCLNQTNGCRLSLIRAHLGAHLTHCPASVIECNSFKVRRLNSRTEKNSHLKHPCPIELEKKQLEIINKEISKDLLDNCQDINKVLLDQDYASLEQFSREKPLRFSRLYGYLIGLDVGKDLSLQTNFSFLSRLLRNVKSQIFKDIQIENCIVFNTEVGCFACRARIRRCEEERFDRLKQLDEFYSLLRNISDFEAFLSEELYDNQKFLNIYEQVFPTPKKVRPEREKDTLDDQELNEKLVQNNKEILKVIELNDLRLNVAKEAPCHDFFEHSDAYKLKETTFTSFCSQLIRRDEFSSHYTILHNTLLPSANNIHMQCPMAQYGCPFFSNKRQFLFIHQKADLINSSQTGSLVFSLPILSSPSQNLLLLDLPTDALYEICDRLDSLSLLSLSQVCRSMRQICGEFLSHRGIVYPKWIKRKNDIPESVKDSFEGKDLLENRWQIKNYAYSFSKNIHNPTSSILRFAAEYNQHVQNCPFKRIRVIEQKFKLC